MSGLPSWDREENIYRDADETIRFDLVKLDHQLKAEIRTDHPLQHEVDGAALLAFLHRLNNENNK